MIVKVAIFVIGVILGGILVVFSNEIDLLSEEKNYSVELKEDLVVKKESSKILVIPKGTVLNFDSQYNDVGNFSLNFIITDLSVFDKAVSDAMYFTEVKQIN